MMDLNKIVPGSETMWTTTPIFRLKIELGENSLEVEGTLELVREIASEFNKMVMAKWFPATQKEK